MKDMPPSAADVSQMSNLPHENQNLFIVVRQLT